MGRLGHWAVGWGWRGSIRGGGWGMGGGRAGGAQSVADLGADGWDLLEMTTVGEVRRVSPHDGGGGGGEGDGDGNGNGNGNGGPVSLRALHRERSGGANKPLRAAAVLPPPPSQPDDVEHWTRAMYVDARR